MKNVAASFWARISVGLSPLTQAQDFEEDNRPVAFKKGIFNPIDAPSGGLTPVPGSPFAAGLNPVSIAVEPSGKFAYVANNLDHSVSAYSLDPASGAMTSIAGSPFNVPDFPLSVTVDGSGSYLLVLGTTVPRAYPYTPLIPRRKH
jgi:DNA-binding beta-propeller fold protein YncE